MNDTSTSGGATTSLIERCTVVRGAIQSSGALVIVGHVEGDVASETAVTISSGGVVHGHVHAPLVVVDGTLVGDATATTSITVGASADLRGDLTTPQLAVTAGARWIGRCEMNPST
jgi:cytoskeletal protein CcmA (bactofilin family)